MKDPVCRNIFLGALVLMLGALFSVTPALGQETPDALAKRVSADILNTIQSDESLRVGNTARMRQVVEEKILPHTNFRRMTSLAVGRFWQQATPAQQQQLTDAFRDLLIYTYSGTLLQIGDKKLLFQPLRADPDSTEVEVHSWVIEPGREPAQLSYRLEKTSEGWKVYDINILRAWLTLSYQSSFEQVMNRSGIEGLIQVLAEKNQQLAKGPVLPLHKRAATAGPWCCIKL